MSRETGAHFVLFDDRETLEKKRTLALELGIRRFFLLYPEIADLWAVLPQEGLDRTAPWHRLLHLKPCPTWVGQGF